MDTFIQNKTNRKDSMLHELWILGMPTIVEQLLQTVVSYVDTAMVGQADWCDRECCNRIDSYSELAVQWNVFCC